MNIPTLTFSYYLRNNNKLPSIRTIFDIKLKNPILISRRKCEYMYLYNHKLYIVMNTKFMPIVRELIC